MEKSLVVLKNLYGEEYSGYRYALLNFIGLKIEIRDFIDAERKLETLLRIEADVMGQNSADYATATVSLIELYIATNRYDKAEEFGRDNLKRAEKINIGSHLSALNQLVEVLLVKQTYTEIPELLQKAILLNTGVDCMKDNWTQDLLNAEITFNNSILNSLEYAYQLDQASGYDFGGIGIVDAALGLLQTTVRTIING